MGFSKKDNTGPQIPITCQRDRRQSVIRRKNNFQITNQLLSVMGTIPSALYILIRIILIINPYGKHYGCPFFHLGTVVNYPKSDKSDGAKIGVLAIPGFVLYPFMPKHSLQNSSLTTPSQCTPVIVITRILTVIITDIQWNVSVVTYFTSTFPPISLRYILMKVVLLSSSTHRWGKPREE